MIKQSLINSFEQTYKYSSSFKIVPEGKVLAPFGLSFYNNEIQINRGTLFGLNNRFLFSVYSPLEGSWTYDKNTLELSIEDQKHGIRIRISKLLELNEKLPSHIQRGTYLGLGGGFHPQLHKVGVYIELISSAGLLENFLYRQTQNLSILENKIDYNLAREISCCENISYLDIKKKITLKAYQDKILSLNKFLIIERERAFKNFQNYVNYLAFFS